MLGSIQWAVRQSSEAENYLTSVERIFEYANLIPENEVAPDDSKDNSDGKQPGERTDGYQFRLRMDNFEKATVAFKAHFPLSQK